MPSFDVVSEVNFQEVRNAVDQVQREIGTRYDFKDSKSSIELKDQSLIIVQADDKMKLNAIQDLLRQKLAKRGVGLKSVVFEEPQAASGSTLRQEVKVKNGIAEEDAKKINRIIKELGLKVSSQIQGAQLRVTGKKRDDLQSVIAHLKSTVSNIELQFVNFRD